MNYKTRVLIVKNNSSFIAQMFPLLNNITFLITHLENRRRIILWGT